MNTATDRCRSGVAISFVAIGLFVAVSKYEIGLDSEALRTGPAIVLILLGVALLAPSLAARLTSAAGPLGNWADKRPMISLTQLAAAMPRAMSGPCWSAFF